MGCILCCNKNPDNQEQNTESKPVEYSWNQRKKLDPKDYTIENINDSCTGRLPGTINGEQFIIQNCKNTKIYLLDNIGTITIDDCTGCDIIIGPVKTSVFIRDCVKCNVMVACQQFRTRDCRNLNVFLSCTSQPIIESTSKFKVGPYQLYYPQLSDQFQSAHLSTFNCVWSDIYDFTPVEDQNSNFSIFPEETQPFDLINSPTSVLNTNVAGNLGDTVSDDNNIMNSLMKMEITDSRKMSVVPYTYGNRRPKLEDGSFQMVSLVLLIYNKGEEKKLAYELLKFLGETAKTIRLIKTRESKLSFETARSLFGPKITEKDPCLQGPIISLEYFGSAQINDCVNAFKRKRFPQGDSSNLIYVSPDVETSKSQIDLINNITNMGMNTS